jgi:serine/threonine-protein kinase RsbW
MTEHSFEAELRIPTSLEMLEHVYEWSRTQLERLPLSENKRYEILLGISEAVTNAIRHGNKLDPNKYVSISFLGKPDGVTVTIGDEGEGFDPDVLPDPTHGEHILVPSGRGVFLLRSLAEEVFFEKNNDGNLVIARFLT